MEKKSSSTIGQVNEEAVAASELMELIGGFQISQAIYVLAKLDVYTTLAEGPLPINGVAEAVGADADILSRLVRTVAPMGLFRRLENDVVELTSKGRMLSRTHPASLRAMTMFWMETHYLPFSELLHTARTGENAAQRYLGEAVLRVDQPVSGVGGPSEQRLRLDRSGRDVQRVPVAGRAGGRRHRWRGRHGAHTATRRRGGPDRHRS